MPKKHKLGFGVGTITEYEDGTAGFVPPASFTQAFRVKISDVTGFSVAKGRKALERQLNILGNGTLLGSASVNHGASEKIEQWFRSHPDFGSHVTPAQAPTVGSPISVADEIAKLAELHTAGALTAEDTAGALTAEEFAAAKSRLLAG